MTAVLEAPSEKPKFPASYTLFAEDLQRLTANRYCNVIGILGMPDAGKTAALVSLYLQVSNARLTTFEFRDSLTLLGFEEIARGARRWNEGSPPSQMTAHTELAAERAAGFLHLKLWRRDAQDSVDFLLPDLPGEWTTSLIDANRHDRLGFLTAADCIWILLDGRSLLDVQQRMLAVHRLRLLLQRLAIILGASKPRVLLVITRKDMGVPPQEVLDRIAAEPVAAKLKLEIIHIASFSEAAHVRPGAGIAELIQRSLAGDGAQPISCWPANMIRGGERQMLRVRDSGELL